MQCKSQDFKISRTNFITVAATIGLLNFILDDDDDDTIFDIININLFMDLERKGRKESVARRRTHKGVGVGVVVDNNWVSKKGTSKGGERRREGGWRVGKVRRRVVVRSGGAENITEIEVRMWK